MVESKAAIKVPLIVQTSLQGGPTEVGKVDVTTLVMETGIGMVMGHAPVTIIQSESLPALILMQTLSSISWNGGRGGDWGRGGSEW
jgi:hypothetical protein